MIELGSLAGRAYTRTDSDMRDLEEIARKEITERKPSPPRRRVFLSFRGEDMAQVNLFRGQAKDENSELDFIDFSLQVPFASENAEYIRRGIRERIKASSVTIVLVGRNTHQSEWVDWEIRETIGLGKNVIAVRLIDDSSVVIPAALHEHGIPVQPWNQRMISDAIENAASR